MRFENPTKWELFLDGFHNFWYALDSYDTIEHFPDDFWETAREHREHETIRMCLDMKDVKFYQFDTEKPKHLN